MTKIEASKKLLSMALPISGTRVVQTLSLFIVTFYMSRFGHDALAASFLIATIRLTLVGLLITPLMAVGLIASRLYSKKNTNELKSLIHQGWAVGIFLALILILLSSYLKEILIYFNQPIVTIPLVMTYFKYFIYALPLFALSYVNQHYCLALKKQKEVFWATLIIAIFSLTTHYLLMFGIGDKPGLGIEGAGIATIYSGLFAFIMTLLIIPNFKMKQLIRFQLSSLKFVKLIITIGFPLLFKSLSDLLLLICSGLMIGLFGEKYMAASQISNEYWFLLTFSLWGFSEGGTFLIGHAIGEKKNKNIIQLIHTSLILSLLLAIIFGLFVLIFHNSLIHLFLQNEASGDTVSIYDIQSMTEISYTLILIALLRTVVFVPKFIFSGVLGVFYDTKFITKYSVLFTWLLTAPLCFWFGFTLDYQASGVTLAPIFSDVIIMLILRNRTRLHVNNLNKQIVNT